MSKMGNESIKKRLKFLEKSLSLRNQRNLKFNKDDPLREYMEWLKQLESLSVEEHQKLIQEAEENLDRSTGIFPENHPRVRDYDRALNRAHVANLKYYLLLKKEKIAKNYMKRESKTSLISCAEKGF